MLTGANGHDKNNRSFLEVLYKCVEKIACPCRVLIHVLLVVNLPHLFTTWLHGFNWDKFVFSYYPVSDGCTS